MRGPLRDRLRASVAFRNLKRDIAITPFGGPMSHKKTHKTHEKPDDPQQPPDLFTADLARDSSGKRSTSMEALVEEDAKPLAGPDEEEYLADPEAHRQHSRKGQAESPREATPNQPEHKKRKH
jgi:hypothetical protein